MFRGHYRRTVLTHGLWAPVQIRQGYWRRIVVQTLPGAKRSFSVLSKSQTAKAATPESDLGQANAKRARGKTLRPFSFLRGLSALRGLRFCFSPLSALSARSAVQGLDRHAQRAEGLGRSAGNESPASGV